MRPPFYLRFYSEVFNSIQNFSVSLNLDEIKTKFPVAESKNRYVRRSTGTNIIIEP